MAVTMPVAALIAPHTWSDTGLFEFTGLDRSPIKSAAEEILAKRLAGWQERYPDVNVRRIVVCYRLADLVKQFESAGAVVLVTGWALVGRSFAIVVDSKWLARVVHNTVMVNYLTSN